MTSSNRPSPPDPGLTSPPVLSGVPSSGGEASSAGLPLSRKDSGYCAAAGHGRNNGHVHHWWIEATDARVGNENLDAVCKLCDATRTFPKFIARQWGGRMEKL
jgi:hypothetical protein